MVVMIWGRGTQTFVGRDGVRNLTGWTTPAEYVLVNGVLRRVVTVQKGRALTDKRARYILGDDLMDEEYRRLTDAR